MDRAHPHRSRCASAPRPPSSSTGSAPRTTASSSRRPSARATSRTCTTRSIRRRGASSGAAFPPRNGSSWRRGSMSHLGTASVSSRRDVPGFCDGDWPPWLQKEILRVLPPPLVLKYAEACMTLINGVYFHIRQEDLPAAAPRARAPRHPRHARARPAVPLRPAMDSDPILTYAPRRHDGRLGMHQWPAGEPVAYDPYDKPGEGDLCGDCASEFDEKGAEFRAWGVAKGRFYFRCGGCKKAILRARTDRFRFPIPASRGPMGRKAGSGSSCWTVVFPGPRPIRMRPSAIASSCPAISSIRTSRALRRRGSRRRIPSFEEAMDAMDLHTALRLADRLGARRLQSRRHPGRPRGPAPRPKASSQGTSRRPRASRSSSRRPDGKPRRRGSGRGSARPSRRRGIRRRRRRRGGAVLY